MIVGYSLLSVKQAVKSFKIMTNLTNMALTRQTALKSFFLFSISTVCKLVTTWLLNWTDVFWLWLNCVTLLFSFHFNPAFKLSEEFPLKHRLHLYEYHKKSATVATKNVCHVYGDKRSPFHMSKVKKKLSWVVNFNLEGS